jgi:hypothetical protein
MPPVRPSCPLVLRSLLDPVSSLRIALGWQAAVSTTQREERRAMVNIVQGAALQPFAGQAMSRHDLPGPGPKAFKILRGMQQTSYLVSTGVYDCAVLTIILPRQVLPRQPGVRVTIGGQTAQRRGSRHGPLQPVQWSEAVGNRCAVPVLSGRSRGLCERPHGRNLLQLRGTPTLHPSFGEHGRACRPWPAADRHPWLWCCVPSGSSDQGGSDLPLPRWATQRVASLDLIVTSA